MPTTSTPTLSTTNSPSTSANSTPRPLSPPLLTLNGSPIAPPSSSAYPPLSPARKRRSSNAKMSASQKQLDPSYQRSRPAAGRSTSSTSSSSGHASRTKNVAIPNPILHPLAFASWIKWRISVWLLGHLALGMLTDVEIFLLFVVTSLLTCVVLYSLFFHLPNHVHTVLGRAAYYLFGVEGASGGGGAFKAALSSSPSGGSPK